MPGTTPEERARIEATPTHLCRLGYLGTPDRWEFAFFKYSFLFDRTQRPHMTADQLSLRVGLSKSTLGAKAKRIQDLLRIVLFEPRYCRRALLADNPLAWMICVDGFLVDARTMPPEIQMEARRKGLIPDLPASAPTDTKEG